MKLTAQVASRNDPGNFSRNVLYKHVAYVNDDPNCIEEMPILKDLMRPVHTVTDQLVILTERDLPGNRFPSHNALDSALSDHHGKLREIILQHNRNCFGHLGIR